MSSPETYKIGVPIFNEEQGMYETKIGRNSNDYPLLYSVWNKDEHTCQEMANMLVDILKETFKIN